MRPIEDYALIGDTHSAGLVSRDGSIDWLCLPRFDSGACFSAILDDERGGAWRIGPQHPPTTVSRRYRDDSLVLETIFETSTGKAALIDALVLEPNVTNVPAGCKPYEVLVRVVQGLSGTVPMAFDYWPRFHYGDVTPWFREQHNGFEAVGGPDALDLLASVPLQRRRARVEAEFEISEGETASFLASYHVSHLEQQPPRLEECAHLIEVTEKFWRDWAGRCSYDGRWRDAVMRSLLTLKALTYSPSGGVVAAATTSLPEQIGGPRNWDYRYCWLRDATFTLDVLLEQGYTDEASEWRDWLLRAVAGDPEDMQIMYGVLGERRLYEVELPWLSGYEDSRPVRVGNRAHEQFQLDVYGELMDSFHSARRAGIDTSEQDWDLEKVVVDYVCEHWQDPDEGIWEVRSGAQHFVHSKVMAWVALDRAIKAIERFGKRGPIERWRSVREAICEEVMNKGVNHERGHFKRTYDSDDEVDGNLLMLPLVGFIDAKDDVMRRTIEKIEEDLVVDGLVRRYRTESVDDGLPHGEGTFLLCSFWLVDCLVLIERFDDARRLFERLVGLSNDVGLLAEQYDIGERRLLGNFPQAFSHVALVASAAALDTAGRTRNVKRGAH